MKVIVVGGGIVGVSTATYLARGGADVVLCERNELAREASAKNLGFLCGRTAFAPGPARDLVADSLEIYRQLPDDLDADLGLRWCGAIYYGRPGDIDRAYLEAVYDERQDPDLPLELVDHRRLRELSPNLADGIEVGLVAHDEGQVDNQLVAQAYAREAQRHGAVIRRDTEIASLQLQGDRVTGVVTRSGDTIQGDVVVAAAGIWSDSLCRTVGARVPLTAMRGQALITRRMAPVIDTLLYNVGALPYHEETGESAPPDGAAHVPYICARQTVDGRVILGCQIDLDAEREFATLSGIATVASGVVEALPILGDAEIEQVYAGMMALPADGLPLAGWSPDREGLCIAVSANYGNTAGPAIGKYVARLLLGDDDLPEYGQSMDAGRLHVSAA